MSRLTIDLTMSLDGYVAGPDPSQEDPLGVGGERLHEWAFAASSWQEQHGHELGEGRGCSTTSATLRADDRPRDRLPRRHAHPLPGGVMSLWPKLAELPLVVEGYELDTLTAEMANGQVRTTILVRIHGAGHDGLGEDVGVMPDDEDPLAKVPAALPLAGEWTLERFCDHLATVEQWPEPPQWDLARLWRNWAFESAALDLALRQAGRPLHEVLEREPRPLRFVNSLGLGDPPADRHHPPPPRPLPRRPLQARRRRGLEPRAVRGPRRHRRRRGRRLQGPVRDGGRGRGRARDDVRARDRDVP